MWRFISPKLWQGPSTSSCMLNLTTWSKSIETDKSCWLQCIINTLQIKHILKRHPRTRPVFKGVCARNRLPRLLNVPMALVGNMDPDNRVGQHWIAILYRSQFKGRVLRPYWNTTIPSPLCEFHEETLSYLDIQHLSSTRRRIYRVWTSLHLLPHSSMCRI